jgi:hypothetical protein
MVKLDEWNVSRCVSRHKKAQFWPATRVTHTPQHAADMAAMAAKRKTLIPPAQEVSRLSLIPGPVD